jgi:hypothetical protein
LEQAVTPRRKRKRAVCRWKLDMDGIADGDVWEGSCGAAWTFIVDGPKENGVNFCPNCGKPLEVMKESADVR